MTLNAQKTGRKLRGKLGELPPIAVVLGSGFDEIAKKIKWEAKVPFKDLPGFPRLTVEGHRGLVIRTRLQGVGLLLLCGRSHYYEGHTMDALTFPVRVLATSGVKILLLTNAAGAIHPQLGCGDFMAIQDHINFMGENPLRGSTEGNASRFVDLTHTYDSKLLNTLVRSARAEKIKCRKGVYLAVSGPSYETPAEIRAFRRLGADAVGMSTVPEAIVAKQCGLRVAGLSFITNPAAGTKAAVISHEEVLRQARDNADKMMRLLSSFVSRLTVELQVSTSESATFQNPFSWQR